MTTTLRPASSEFNQVGGTRQRLLIHGLSGIKSQRKIKNLLTRKNIAYNVLNEHVIELVNVIPEVVDALARKIPNITSPSDFSSEFDAVLFFDHFDHRSRRNQYRCYSHLAPNRKPKEDRPTASTASSRKWKKQKGAFLATDLAQIYRFPPNQQSNGEAKPTIGIVSLGGSFLAKDLETYWTKVCGINASDLPKVTVVSVDGASYNFGDDPDSDLENTLDLEVAGGANPHCNLVLYSAPNTDTGFYNAISTAIYDRKNNPSILSISWGAPEDQSSESVILATSQLFAKASKRGMNVVVASGDNGSGDGESGVHVDFPASSPYVTCCGGTTLRCRTNNYQDVDTQEVAWSWNREHGWGTGGGLSSLFPAPWYQKNLLPIGFEQSPKMRVIPDVSAVADPRSPVAIYFNDKMTEMGGTSAVAPLFAALLAALNIAEFFTPLLYEARRMETGVFHDILKGKNPTYQCGKGYTCCCGCGSIDGVNFQNWYKSKQSGFSPMPVVVPTSGVPVPVTPTTPSARSTALPSALPSASQTALPSTLPDTVSGTVSDTYNEKDPDEDDHFPSRQERQEKRQIERQIRKQKRMERRQIREQKREEREGKHKVQGARQDAREAQEETGSGNTSVTPVTTLTPPVSSFIPPPPSSKAIPPPPSSGAKTVSDKKDKTKEARPTSTPTVTFTFVSSPDAQQVLDKQSQPSPIAIDPLALLASAKQYLKGFF